MRLPRRRRLVEALFLSLLATGGIPSASASGPLTPLSPSETEQTLYLEVRVNTVAHPQLLPFIEREGKLSASPETLQALGFRLDDRQRAQALLPLDGLGVKFDYDMSRQRLDILAGLEQLSTSVHSIGQSQRRPRVTATLPGAILNYDVDARQFGASSNIVGAHELRIFGRGNASLSSSGMVRAHRIAGGPWQHESHRLDTQWRWVFPERALEWVLGDTYSSDLPWSRGLRVGGLRIGTDYGGLQPYRVTTALPVFRGEATLPSRIELYVDGMKRYSGDVPVGAFELNAIPGISGSGRAQLQLIDAYGQRRQLDYDFYSSPFLTSPGLTEWSFTAGLPRRGYGVRSFEYASTPVFSASLQHGINRYLTLSAHGEHFSDLRNAGMGAAVQLGRAGVVHGNFSRSAADAGRGSQHGIGYQWNNAWLSVALERQRASTGYRDAVAVETGLRPIRASDSATLGIGSRRTGNFHFNYLRLRTAEQMQTRFAGAGWMRQMGWGSLSVSANYDLDDRRNRQFQLGVFVPLGERQLSLSTIRNAGRTSGVAEYAKVLPGDGGMGWRLRAATGAVHSVSAEAGWLNEVGQWHLGIARNEGQTESYAQARGSLVLTGGTVFPARSSTDSFALVSTSQVPGIPVMLENRRVGVTNKRGLLLVTQLGAWQENRLSIDPLQLPADMRVAHPHQIVVPRSRAGSLADFRIAKVQAAVIMLHDASGVPLPLGTAVSTLNGTPPPEATIVGYDGEVYLEGLTAHNRLRMTTPSGVCAVEFDLPSASDRIVRIGPLACKKESGP